jgi:signal recognition particle subunit SRP54
VFQGLAEKLQATLGKLRSRGKLTEQDVDAALREVRLALLEADVNYKVVKSFTSRVKERAVGEEVLKSLTPAQQVVKIVHDELRILLGGQEVSLKLDNPPTTIMLVGLQGSGKTTSTAKLANHLKKKGKKPLMIAADVYRPAAVKQLQVLGEQLGIAVFSMGTDQDPVNIAKAGYSHALSHGHDVILCDTAGRLHIDGEMMDELVRIKSAINPAEILFVADAMTGQDAVNVAATFNEQLDVSGIILTKLDGDARGGAALSIKEVTGKPIKFVGMGEKTDALEVFHPDRVASRILGMGDVLTLIEKAESAISEEEAKKLGERIITAQFTLDDFLDQLQQIKKMGPLDQLLGMIPGFSQAKKMQGFQVDEGQLKSIEAIIQSMTPQERSNPDIIDGSRRRRIATGSGTKVQDVNRLLKQFKQAKQMMRQLGALDKGKKPKGKMRSFLQ